MDSRSTNRLTYCGKSRHWSGVITYRGLNFRIISNQTSLSGSDVGKTGALFQSGNIKSKEVSDPGESKGFLDTLRALFRSESGSGEAADVSEANASETEGSETESGTDSVESLLVSDIKAESSE